MAISIKQTPMTPPDGTIQMLTGTITPVFSTWNWSTSTALYSDFKYVINIKDEDDTYTFNTVAEDDDNWSKLSVNDLLKNKLTNIFQPKVLSLTNNPGSISNYLLEITPWNNGDLINSSSATTNTMFSIKSSVINHGRDEFLNSEDSKLLVDIDNHNMSLDTYATNKALYGNFAYSGNSYASGYTSEWTKVVYEITRTDGSTELYELSNSYSSYTPTSDTMLSNTDDMLIEIPIGPKNLGLGSFLLVEVVLGNGYVFYPNTNVNMILNNGDKYKYAVYSGNTRVSKEYFINVMNCTTRYTPMPISWLNESGAYNTFECYAKNEKSISVKNKTYTKTPYRRINDYYYDDSTTNAGEVVYEQDIQELYELHTDWLTHQQIVDMEDLWTSPDIYIEIDDDHYPVISTTKKAVINNKANKHLFKYRIDVRIAKKKYRL